MKLTNPKAILFDLDDTIVAWDIVAEHSWRAVCGTFAPETDGVDSDTLYSAINRCREWYLSDMDRHRFARLNLDAYRREVVTMALVDLEVNHDGLVDRITEAYGTEREAACYVLPGALDTLLHFRRQGIRLALVSNGVSDGQWRKVKRFGLVDYFDFILIEGDFGVGKPDGRVFQRVLEELHVTAGDAWMVGDSLTFDITVWVDWQGIGLPQPAPVHPDRIVRGIAELV
jgi:putative hydrolase of the HAD superfamily